MSSGERRTPSSVIPLMKTSSSVPILLASFQAAPSPSS